VRLESSRGDPGGPARPRPGEAAAPQPVRLPRARPEVRAPGPPGPRVWWAAWPRSCRP